MLLGRIAAPLGGKRLRFRPVLNTNGVH